MFLQHDSTSKANMLIEKMTRYRFKKQIFLHELTEKGNIVTIFLGFFVFVFFTVSTPSPPHTHFFNLCCDEASKICVLSLALLRQNEVWIFGSKDFLHCIWAKTPTQKTLKHLCNYTSVNSSVQLKGTSHLCEVIAILVCRIKTQVSWKAFLARCHKWVQQPV